MKDEIEIDGRVYVAKDTLEDEDDVEYVEIPNNIDIDESGDIVFNDGEQVLWVRQENYCVTSKTTGCGDYSDRFVLVPCRREELESGDTAFRSDEEHPDFSELWGYCKILDEERYVRVRNDGDGVREYSEEWYSWWKLVRKEEVEDDE